MARNYKTAEREFIEDVILQPNLELSKLALLKQEKDFNDNKGTLDVLGVPNFNYDRLADQEYANEVSQKWADKAKAATEALMQDPTNPANKRLVADLTREFETDTRFGDIFKLETNYANIEGWKAKLAAMESGGDREMYQTPLSDYYSGAGGYGAREGMFSGPELYDSKQFTFDNFVTSDMFKHLGINQSDIVSTTPNGGWIVKEGEKTKELSRETIANGFKASILDNPNLMNRIQQGIEIFGEDNWLDAEGNISFEAGSRLGNSMLRGVEATTYKQVDKDKDMTETHASKAATDFHYAKKLRELDREEVDLIAAGDVDASDYAGKNMYVVELERDYVNNLIDTMVKGSGGKLTQADARKKLKNLDDIIRYARDNKYKTVLTEATNLRSEIEKIHKGSNSHLLSLGLDNATINNLQKELDHHYATFGTTFTYTTGRGTVKDNVTGKDISRANIFGKAEWKPEEVIGKKHILPGRGSVLVEEVVPVGKSLRIIPVNSPAKTGKSLRENMGVAMMQIGYRDIDPSTGLPSAEMSYYEMKVYVDLNKSTSIGRGPDPSVFN